MRRTPALIVGGGPAGTAAAIVLARARAPHLLVERTRETGDAICGGFLSWRTLDALARLGIDADTLTPRGTRRVRLYARGHGAEAMLPRPARTVSRHRLDTVMMAHAIATGACVERGVTVRAIEDLRARTEDDEIAADALFLASGKHDVRGLARPAAARGHDPTLGLRVRIAATPGLTRLVGDAIELHMFDRGYVGLALQEDGSANVCMAVHRSRLAESGTPEALLVDLARECPALGERLAYNDGGAIDAIANVPYGWRATDGVPALYRLGDQAAVIPSLAGEGMGIAIASGASAARAYLAGEDGAGWQRSFARRTRRPVGIADAVRVLAEARATAPLLVAAARLAPALTRLVAHATRIHA